MSANEPYFITLMYNISLRLSVRSCAFFDYTKFLLMQLFLLRYMSAEVPLFDYDKSPLVYIVWLR